MQDEYEEHCPCSRSPIDKGSLLKNFVLEKPARLGVADPEATFVWLYYHQGARNDELRWSIRSVEANYAGKASILIVGDKPPWYRGQAIEMTRVPPMPFRSYRDTLNKMHAACVSSLVPDRFVWMMDDTYLMSKVSMGQLQRNLFQPMHLPDGEWGNLKRATLAEMSGRGMKAIDYCTHKPHVIHKDKWLETWGRYGLANRVLQWEMLYGADHFTMRERLDPRLFQRYRTADGPIPDTLILNNTHDAWCEVLRATLYARFPRQSKYESLPARPPRWDKLAPFRPADPPTQPMPPAVK